MLDWFSCIPAWSVAFTGAFIVLLSLATSSIWLRHIESRIIRMGDKREKLQSSFSSCIEQLKRSDTHHLHAAVFLSQLGLIQQRTREDRPTSREFDLSFIFRQIGDNQLQSVLCAMTAAGMELPIELPENLCDLSDRINGGDLEASNEMNRRRNELVGQAVEYSNHLQDDRKRLSGCTAHLEARARLVRSFSVTLNLFGLILVMTTHLPIWKVP